MIRKTWGWWRGEKTRWWKTSGSLKSAYKLHNPAFCFSTSDCQLISRSVIKKKKILSINTFLMEQPTTSTWQLRKRYTHWDSYSFNYETFHLKVEHEPYSHSAALTTSIGSTPFILFLSSLWLSHFPFTQSFAYCTGKPTSLVMR
jgi:hypothetical protein